MQLRTRKILDRAFSGIGVIAIGLVAAALLVILGPIVVRGTGAFVFHGTVEFRHMMWGHFGRGDEQAVAAEVALARKARQPVYEAVARFESELTSGTAAFREKYQAPFEDLKANLRALLGPLPDDVRPVAASLQYGATRLDKAEEKLRHVLNSVEWDYSSGWGKEVLVPRLREFQGTSIELMLKYVAARTNFEAMMRPRLTFYGRFLFDRSIDSHFFGGIWAELLGTFYLTIGAMIFAVPMGVIAAIYFVEYAGEGRVISLLRTCVSTLAGVPSIVFGLFGVAFFIMSIHVSHSRSVLAGSLTLALLVLPIIIRASEEALLAVPRTYKEAALSLGSSRWRTITQVILPAALPGIITGIVISMGRAAGETAPIIFTAAVSMGPALHFWQVLDEATPALPWNIYNLATEHQQVEEIRHVQYGMVLTLVTLVLLLNLTAIWLRARISRKLRG